MSTADHTPLTGDLRQTPQPELHLRADRNTRYETIADVMSKARTAGIEKMGFVTVPESTQ